MAIIVENLTVNGRQFTHTYSDDNRYVVRDGIAYEDAMDPADKNRVYTEGERIIRNVDIFTDDTELSDDQIINVLMGGTI